ncbi:hypothetical protein F4821DRAFT_19458 [Hypoxylon rubiginosum]|uniref:Uncharacterized protein n=1 Tax=Hypoxylon rubiginosum TaxID=110542 RepID=A0ACC0DDN3_9PEZI|nr:hypothetical protein F4821DRAFT_19458 [Hypoxylon rubiginosum]
MEGLRGSSPAKGTISAGSPEQLLDSFKAAALSVTKLYKSSAAGMSKARADGYQDCLDDLLSFLDKSNIGLSDGEGWQIRKWATERLDGRESLPAESEDEVEKSEPTSSPEMQHSVAQTSTTAQMHQPAPPAPAHQPEHPTAGEHMMAVPTQEVFTFRSAHPYPQEAYANLNMEKLDLSDSIRLNDNATQGSGTVPIAHTGKSRNGKRGNRPRPANQLGKGAGQKRTINLSELFDVRGVSFGPKDVFDREGRDGKRSRHT